MHSLLVNQHPDPAKAAANVTECVEMLTQIRAERKARVRDCVRTQWPMGAALSQRMSHLFLDPRMTLLFALRRGNPHLLPLPQPTETTAENHWEKNPPPLVVMKFSVESRMLVQAGRRPSPQRDDFFIDSPECMMGKECKGHTLQINGFDSTPAGTMGVTLMAAMTPDELDAHELTGKIPQRLNGAGIIPHARPTMCVLCARYHITELLLNSECHGFPIERKLVAQWFCNPVDQIDGYAASACLLPTSPLHPNGLVAPIVRLQHSHYRAVRDKAGTWWIRQDPLQWHPPSVGRDFPYGTNFSPLSTPPRALLPQRREPLLGDPAFFQQLFPSAAV
jgi:hypothetical protein